MDCIDLGDNMAWGYSTLGRIPKNRLTQKAKPKEGATLVIAASNSNDTTRGDYICTGSSDEITINQAITALPSIGGEIHLMEGTYNIAASIVISGDNISLVGSGDGTKITTTENIQMITASNVNNIRISRILLDGAISGTNNNGIYFDTVGNGEISEVHYLVWDIMGYT